MALILSRRLPFTLICAAAVALLAFGYFLQFYSAQDPCPLCIFQRVCFFAIALVAGIAALHGARLGGASVYCGMISLLAITGASIAGRQVWLQHLPADQVPECGPGLDFLWETYPAFEAISKALRGTGDCARVDWTFLSLSIAEWSLLFFLSFLIAALAIIALRTRQRPHRIRIKYAGK